jgi:hypothetical protein
VEESEKRRRRRWSNSRFNQHLSLRLLTWELVVVLDDLRWRRTKRRRCRPPSPRPSTLSRRFHDKYGDVNTRTSTARDERAQKSTGVISTGLEKGRLAFPFDSSVRFYYFFPPSDVFPYRRQALQRHYSL